MNQHLFSALLKAQSEMAILSPDSKNPHLRSEYASLAAVLKTCRPALAKHGLVLYQGTYTMLDESPTVVVTSTLVHAESGESIAENLSIPLTKMTAQEIGSAITYGRRYLAMAQAGLAPDDDDGNDASTGQRTASQQQQAQPVQQAPVHRAPVASNNSDKPAAKSKEFKRLMAEGTKTFNGQWDNARHWLIERYTRKATPDNVRTSANDLTDGEIATLVSALVGKKDYYVAEWAKVIAERAAAQAEQTDNETDALWDDETEQAVAEEVAA